MKSFTVVLLICLITLPAAAQWNTAYYATWNQTTLGGSSWNGEHLGEPPDQVDWTGITHVVHFGNGNVVSTPPYSLFATDSTEIIYGPDGGSVNYQKLLITTAHAHGVKVCLSIQAVDPSGLHVALASQSTANVFCDWIISYCKIHGYDGVEIDWEGESPDPTLATRLILTLRTYLNKYYSPARGLILLSPGLSDYNSYPAAVCDTAVDQFNPQLYAMMWTPNNTNHTWHTCAVYPGTAPSGEDDGAIDGLTDGSAGYIQQWINAGHNPSKMGMLLPTFGYFFLGADGLFQSWTSCLGHNGSTTVTQNSMLTGLLSVGGVETWDAVRQMSYISGTATAAYGGAEYGGVAKGQKFFATLATPQWIQAVVQYFRTKTFGGKSLGGVSLYSLTEDFDPTKPAGQGRNIIHDALRDALGGVAPQILTTSVSSLPNFGSVNVNASSASVSYTVSGSNLTSNVTVAAPANFQVSLDNTTFSASVTIAPTGGTVSAKTVYARFTPTAGGAQSGYISHTSGTATAMFVAVAGTGIAAGAPTGTFTASPASLPAGGGSVKLTWTSTNATTASIDQGVGTEPLNGSTTVSVTATKTFTLTLTNANGSKTYTATVTVAATPAPTGSLSASPSSLPAGGGSATLTWSSTNATSASIDQGIGTVALSGSRQVTLTATRTYTLTLTNATGSKTYSATITVAIPTGAPTGTLTVSPSSLPVGGGNATLTWTSTNATSASFDQGIGTVALSGSRVVAVTSTSTYTLSLTNTSGTRTYAATVTVDTASAPPPDLGNDITPLATPIAAIPSPTGEGNHDITIIKLESFPAQGSTNVQDQFDTFTGGGPRTVDWVGYSFTNGHVFTGLLYQKGLDNHWGGCFTGLQVQVRSAGTWHAVTGLTSTPAYTPNDGINFETYAMAFDATTGDAIRIYGAPTGDAHYIGVARLRAYDNGSPVTPPVSSAPREYGLDQNYPNPFNPATHLSYKLPADMKVTLIVRNLLGQSVAVLVDGYQSAGVHGADFSGDHMASGIYFAVLITPEFMDMRKMVLIH
ncbi:MAG TPA: glycosyl hydrolase family 18 protein [Bacteroidota bacterium]|nr:glycosyl hydrolase family 18 protein [Bacteroidota bacterium]